MRAHACLNVLMRAHARCRALVRPPKDSFAKSAETVRSGLSHGVAAHENVPAAVMPDQPTPHPDAWLTRAMAAEYLHVHVSTIDRWRRQGLESAGTHGRRLYQRKVLDAWVVSLGHAIIVAVLAVMLTCTLLVVRGCAAHHHRQARAVAYAEVRTDKHVPPTSEPHDKGLHSVRPNKSGGTA